jgi:predicted nucleic acid-binding protein
VILVDSNIIIDIVQRDPTWAVWSLGKVATLSDVDSMAVNEVVIAEVAPVLGSLSAFRAEMELIAVQHEALSAAAAFCAGVAFREYRQNRRARKDDSKSIIADFLIGGHAETLGATILTRDPRFYRTYFPTVPLITPEKADE